MGLFKIFKKKGAEAGAAIARLENKDLVEATIYGAVLVAYADGDLEDSELENLQLQIEANDIFQGFPQSEIGKMIDKAVGLFKAGAILGRKKALDQIKDLVHDADSGSEAFAAIATVALSDGEIEPAEEKILREIAKISGVRYEEFVG